jgi:hypothetical protein
MTRPDVLPARRSDGSPGMDATVNGSLRTPLFWTLVGLIAAAVWLRPITSSLWTDEMGTWWVISGNARQVVQRAAAVQGQSPLYYLVAWAIRHVTGQSELGLRLPSVVFCIVAVFLTYRIAKRLIDTQTAAIAAIMFALWPPIAFAASDARPYALASLATLASAWALIAWLDSPSVWKAVCFAVLSASVPYVHPVFGLVLIVFAVYTAARIREGSTDVRAGQVVGVVLGVAALTVPVALELLALWHRQRDWLIPNPLTVSWVGQMLVPPALVGALVLAVLFTARKLRLSTDPRRLPRSTLILLLGWFLIPSGVLVGLAIVSPVRLIMARYLMIAAPGGVLLAALLLRSLEPASVRRIVILAFAILSLLTFSTPVKSGDFRGAAELARSVADERSVVLIRSGFVESLQPSWYSDPERQGLLTAAASFYPLPGTVVPLPASLDENTVGLVRAQVASAIGGSDDVVVISLTGSSFEPWFDEYMRERGWTSHVVGDVNLFTVTEFARGTR